MRASWCTKLVSEQIQNNWQTIQKYCDAGKIDSQLDASLKCESEFGKQTGKQPQARTSRQKITFTVVSERAFIQQSSTCIL